MAFRRRRRMFFKRRRMGRRRSRRLFTKTAMRTHRRNSLRSPVMRGGIRL